MLDGAITELVFCGQQPHKGVLVLRKVSLILILFLSILTSANAAPLTHEADLSRSAVSGIRPEALALISDIISSDVARGFPGAQLAVIRNGQLIYSNAWGKTDSTNPHSPSVTRDTLYDLASVTKVLAADYAVQKLVSDGKLDVDAKISDILGDAYLTETITAPYSPVSKKTMRKWKSSVTVRDVMCHRAGYPPEIHYYDKNYDLSSFRHNVKSVNPLYSGITPDAETRAKTLTEILRTPLQYQPRTKIVYSDIDYMLICFVAEKVSGMRLDVYLAENFWRPLGLTHMTFNPLDNGFSPGEIAATETDGNTTTRGYEVRFPGLRDSVIVGEVHDEKAYHSMAGVSGHAGLFANAEDTVRLLSLMLTGEYGGQKFFPREVVDMFTSPQDESGIWGIGWWRRGSKRTYYFGTQSSPETFGHQGFTGTLVMIDPVKKLVIAYFTNKLNTPAVMPLSRNKTFAGSWYTASTLGFVPEILYTGIDTSEDISGKLAGISESLYAESLKQIPKGAGKNHPSRRNAESKNEVLERCNSRP
ncbi:MAG: serine hydrolase [Synergistaceae bacterium]|nr:serine hydrolase [Synergistaceae bacterium]